MCVCVRASAKKASKYDTRHSNARTHMAAMLMAFDIEKNLQLCELIFWNLHNFLWFPSLAAFLSSESGRKIINRLIHTDSALIKSELTFLSCTGELCLAIPVIVNLLPIRRLDVHVSLAALFLLTWSYTFFWRWQILAYALTLLGAKSNLIWDNSISSSATLICAEVGVIP